MCGPEHRRHEIGNRLLARHEARDPGLGVGDHVLLGLRRGESHDLDPPGRIRKLADQRQTPHRGRIEQHDVGLGRDDAGEDLRLVPRGADDLEALVAAEDVRERLAVQPNVRRYEHAHRLRRRGSICPVGWNANVHRTADSAYDSAHELIEGRCLGAQDRPTRVWARTAWKTGTRNAPVRARRPVRLSPDG